LKKASREGARVLIVRAGDFFGPAAGNNWFSQGLVKPGLPVKTIRYPGRRGVGHQWSYLPDVGRTMVELLARRDTLDAFASFHMAGHWDADGTQMSDAIRRVVARRTGNRAARRGISLVAAHVGLAVRRDVSRMGEMRYLWKTPVRMDNARLVAVLGREPHTPLDHAVEATLDGMGNLDKVEGARIAAG